MAAWHLGLALKVALLVGIVAGSSVWLVAAFVSQSSLLVLAASGAVGAAAAGFLVVEALIVRRIRKASQLATSVRNLGVAGDDGAGTGSDELRDLTRILADSEVAVAERIANLRRIENYREEFLGDVSHELQTPIFAVEGFAETLLDGALEDASVNRSFVEKIHRNARRLSALVNDLSDISQIETGSLRMNLVAFDPGQLVHDSVEALELLAEQSGIVLHAFIGRDIGSVIGDRERVRQVLVNLLTNGIKYNAPGGSVELAVWQSGGNEITFSITDDGIGIAADDIARVTERFYRVDKSRSRDRGGTGLGLAIVKHIVEAHGSTLLIQSKLDHGSTFSFALPKAPAPPRTEPSNRI